MPCHLTRYCGPGRQRCDRRTGERTHLSWSARIFARRNDKHLPSHFILLLDHLQHRHITVLLHLRFDLDVRFDLNLSPGENRIDVRSVSIALAALSMLEVRLDVLLRVHSFDSRLAIVMRRSYTTEINAHQRHILTYSQTGQQMTDVVHRNINPGASAASTANRGSSETVDEKRDGVLTFSFPPTDSTDTTFPSSSLPTARTPRNLKSSSWFELDFLALGNQRFHRRLDSTVDDDFILHVRGSELREMLRLEIVDEVLLERHSEAAVVEARDTTQRVSARGPETMRRTHQTLHSNHAPRLSSFSSSASVSSSNSLSAFLRAPFAALRLARASDLL